MNPLFCIRRCIQKSLSHIHLVDKILCIFMLILLIQSAYTIFTSNAASAQINNIDIVIRTSAAAIFGYFLSANFIRHASHDESDTSSSVESDTSASAASDSGQSDFAASDSENKDQSVSSPETTAVWASDQNHIDFNHADFNHTVRKKNSYDPATAYRMQVIAASFIGLFCLITLLIYRNILVAGGDTETSSSILAAVTQFRDFISGCIGFLIGSPTQPAQKNTR